MGIFSKFEGKMEDTLEGAAGSMSKAPISPVQIAKKAEKQMRRETMVGAGKEYAPTLYTVLVNPEDDTRLFGYYPTLAGETETYLSGKASQEGLLMDGRPLVRFVVDEGLKHGKCEVIAELVAAPIIEQLRAEEMQRYGIAPRTARPQQPQARPQQMQPNQGTPSQPYPQAAGPNSQDFDQNAGYDNYPAQDAGYDNGYDNYPAQEGGYDNAYDDGYDYGEYGFDYEQYANDDMADEVWNNGHGYGYDIPEEEPIPAEPQVKPPLPYVPEEEIDRSIDYGEYTFNSEDFEDYRDKADADDFTPAYNDQPQDAGAGAAAQAAPGAPAAPAAVAQPNTVAFTGSAQQPNHRIIRARLVDRIYQRPYDLAGTLVTLGRDSTNDIVVQDINASRRHAELRLNMQGIWVITDLSSMNGTLVNGVSVASHPLYPGDIVTIGKTDFEFTLV